MYSRELASARQVEPVNQALGTVIFRSVPQGNLSATLQGEKDKPGLEYGGTTQGSLPATLQGEKINQALNTDEPHRYVNSPTGIDSGSRRAPQDVNSQKNRFWLRRSPTGCKLTTGIEPWLEEEPLRSVFHSRDLYWIKVAFKTSGQSPGSSLEKVGISDGNCLGGDNGVSAVSGRGTDVTSAA
ncbi:hypothetical protein EVAR_20700_1 [Eumeta japonica]|uniref:Uncharacterized protein n=1 Tax=Eumeta variegata TaxID=151549 RepID=A0A4C1VAJ4_EUMVA|nr:hypothetical protein EVAR_20700_1 [Eumeta japonica]